MFCYGETKSSFSMEDLLEQLLALEMLSDDEDDGDQVELEAELKGFTSQPHHQSLNLESPSSEEPPKLELKVLPSHLKYIFLEEKLINGLKKFKKEISWMTTDIRGISPSFCMHKIILEDGEKGTIDGQRRLNPIMKELDARIIYPLSGSSWVRLVQYVPKKGGITVVKNENNELIPTRTVTGWRICIDYCKLTKATQKNHFPLPFLDQMLDKLAGHDYYYFLDG
ncbi:Retrovirus-related Pol polyprotein from transposon 17.6 [Gossypium australe]|uniref:Retrovirus-related Pol polyprotein from transposon 17.6 n=1 Tax=Gossypium australe TaxID=47621 RepID=A0A5B6V9V9_9ROSI|nr:Retrovirus-related Pol polyprotein from transposon 17.6 [Gossypium australe]